MAPSKLKNAEIGERGEGVAALKVASQQSAVGERFLRAGFGKVVEAFGFLQACFEREPGSWIWQHSCSICKGGL